LGKLAKLRHEFQELGTTAEGEEAVDEELEKVLEEEWPKWVSE
jgi:predicted component of type VI protein secretion system